ncbi:MAG: 50S ribosomal protein L30 [Chloroflexi bacterium]|nr:MAG: 50S ribosomal protein L30 [Chloroflexota bacterium]MBL1196663.1 50S ribosomal protein L30 [Chloroflexota bacterium]NOH13956.1 50S ribosomal protein L30 [Chloroflexota bacterium]
MADKKATKALTITLVKSPIGYSKRQKGTVKALGLRRINHSVTHDDTPVIRGMINKVGHLVQVEEN